ncbi:MAG TPA: aromatic ring-hydroxylating dioxygenase subunit alpha [Allosphingosinicella sp.]|nr:aromatic ring-hydroxylating dioxygenase subunit alpha [Allosphingosinicella sp.]
MTYARNTWYVAAWADEIEPGKPSAVRILGEPIVLWRSDGRLVAFEDRCVHRLAPLSLGRCEGASLRCMYHGLLFDADGRCVEIPGQSIIPPQARLKTYPVVEMHSWAWIWMGDPDKADEALIPPAVGLDHPDWILGRGQLDYEAEARLINDNLLDLSHVSYVHEASLQGGLEFAEVLPKWDVLPHGLRYTRWMVGTTRPSGGDARKTDVPVDDFLTYDFMIPGILLLYNASFPAGTAAACDFGPPDRSQAIGGSTFSSQAVTPTGDRTSRYFFSAGPHRDHGDEAVRDMQIALVWQAFAEDKRMIEHQQRVIDETDQPRVMPTAHDRSLTLFNRMVEKLAREDGQALAVPELASDELPAPPH